ncbi:FAD-binding and (Fe-S)-binding domain-containing protein [Kitasatospora gansuensis]
MADAVRREPRATVTVVTDPAEQRQLWAVREAGAGIVTRLPGGGEAWPGWEDSAVPVERLGDYLRELRALLGRHRLRGIPYGHFGEGCIHLRLDFPLTEPQRLPEFREFMKQAADLVVAHGGSLSGEHGDGQARGELLSRMYPPEIIDLFRRFKRIWDPAGLLNPGTVVDPRPLDADLRFPGRDLLPLALPYERDGGSLLTAVHRCVGVGKCVDTSSGVMCPSYLVTEEERHSTRGRARLLAEMLRGELVTDGWRSPEVREALDLCLGCKGCASDCPVQVDMATYRSEFLHQHYRRRLRPASHYSMGWLPLTLRLAFPAACSTGCSARPPPPSSSGSAGSTPARAAAAGHRDLRTLVPPPDRRPRRPGGAALAGHLHQPPRPGPGPRRRRTPRTARLHRPATRRPGLLRPHLALHRPTRRRPQGVAAQPGRPSPALPILGLDPSCTATLREELPACSARQPATSPAGCTHWPSSSTARASNSPAGRRPGDHPDPLPPARRPRHRGRPPARPAHRPRQPGARPRLLRPGRELRLRTRPLRGLRRPRRTRPAPRHPVRRRDHRPARRRLQLPHPDQPTRRRPQGRPPGRTPPRRTARAARMTAGPGKRIVDLGATVRP